MDPKCREMVEKMQEFLDGECDEQTCHTVEEHLASCHHCEDCLESIRRTIEFLRRSREETLPADYRESLRAALASCVK